LKLINTITRETIEVETSSSDKWIRSCTPWAPVTGGSLTGLSKTASVNNKLKKAPPIEEEVATPSSLLQEIFTWSGTLPAWLQDACRRLFLNEGELTSQDYQELYSLMKSELDVFPSDQAAVPLSQEHLPASINPDMPVTLKSMGPLENVNKIKPDQRLEFLSKGMTVVFGGNGSGKSGYARVLKKACRARDQSEPIHPDASNADSSSKVPTGEFETVTNGQVDTIKWTRDEASPETLSTITVFDTRCARSILTDEHDVAYLPYGLDIVESLANQVIPTIKGLIEAEINDLDVNTSPFDFLNGDTAVGTMISLLSADTNPSDVQSLGQLTPDEQARLAELNRILSSTDPAVKAEELKLSKERLKSLASDIQSPLSWVSQAAVEKLEELSKEKSLSEEADKQAAKKLQAGEQLLPGTGGGLWKLLFESAMNYSTEEAYSGESFPPNQADASCPLCQTELDESAIERLTRFREFIKADISKLAQEKKKALEDALQKIQNSSLDIGISQSLSGEISMLDPTLLTNIQKFETSVINRKAAMLSAAESGDWGNIPELEADPRSDIRRLAAKQLKAARNFLHAADPETKKKLEKEKEELQARSELARITTTLLNLLENLRLEKELKKCDKNLKTRPISDKSKELASKAVSDELKIALDNEFRALGVDHIKTILKERSHKGQMRHRLLLDVPVKNKIDEILSEGEQRSIALASFFAELSTANHGGGIILDDPVSSLDHWRRINVAKRLVKESSVRQVIIFTHDTSFLGQLRDEISQAGTEHKLMYIEREGAFTGCVYDGLPWGHQDYKERLNSIEENQKELCSRWSPYPSEADITRLRHLYSNLRATIERVIQDVIFNGVVKRYRDWVKVNMLEAVVGFSQNEHDTIIGLYKRCCDVVESHDPSSDKGISIPSATDLGTDIQQLRQLITNIKQRRKK
jgi:energy-coupling factor transporter ATP-binding protein EcfA2